MSLASRKPLESHSKPLPSAAARIESAVEQARAARLAGQHPSAIEQLLNINRWIQAESVRRELRVAIHRELGLSYLELEDIDKAQEAFLLAKEQANNDSALLAPVAAMIATMELMRGRPKIALQALSELGRQSQSLAIAKARIHLYEEAHGQADSALHEADHARGDDGRLGSLLAYQAPSAVLRCFSAIWSQRPEQAQLLYDGVSTRESPYWELLRSVLMRALWMHTGDSRYLSLALSTLEPLRFEEAPLHMPGFIPGVTAQHAAVLALVGDKAMSVETADLAFSAIRPHLEQPEQHLILPEWPLPAILADILMVYKNAGAESRWDEAYTYWNELSWGHWKTRMRLVSGPNAIFALEKPQLMPVHDTGPSNFESLALRLLEAPRHARLMALRSVGAHTQALGVSWLSKEQALLGRVGAWPEESSDPENPALPLEDDIFRLKLKQGESILLYKAEPALMRQLDRQALERLAEVVTLREKESVRIQSLEQALQAQSAAKQLAEERLEEMRRPGSAKGHGGLFPTVMGRSLALQKALNHMASLMKLKNSIVFQGLPGSGRQHLAQAFFLALIQDPTDSARAPLLDAQCFPRDGAAQVALLERFEKTVLAHHRVGILAHVSLASEEAKSWLLARLASTERQSIRWLITLDEREDDSFTRALKILLPDLVRVPSLDERLEDLPLLSDAFIRAMGKQAKDLSRAARAVLARRPFPQQVEELKLVLRQAASQAGEGQIQPEHIKEHQSQEAFLDENELLSMGLKEARRQVERQLISRALLATSGNLGRAADLLGISREELEALAEN